MLPSSLPPLSGAATFRIGGLVSEFWEMTAPATTAIPIIAARATASSFRFGAAGIGGSNGVRTALVPSLVAVLGVASASSRS